MLQDSKIWAISTIAFMLAYTINYIPYIIKIPLAVNKHILAILLIISYGSTYDIKATLDKPQSALIKSNTYCLFLFVTFPTNILLLPFFFMSILNISSYVIKNRKRYETFKIYELTKQIMLRKRIVYLFCCILEVLMIPMCILLMVFGLCTLLTFLAYFYIVLFEYQMNGVMKEALHIVRKYCDTYSQYLGAGRIYYLNARNCLIRNFAIKDDRKNE